MSSSHLSVEIHDQLLLAIPLLPLIGALVLSIMIGRQPERQGLAGWIATTFALFSFVIAAVLFFRLDDRFQSINSQAWTWFEIASYKANFAFRFDRLSAVMTLIVTGVGSLIHLYAIGYMAHDESRARFFCYLNLFLFSMLLLVLGNNLLVMFVGWEGVGLCSYLLIGFWYKEMDNAIAGQKAFVVNRIGDAGFILGIFTLLLSTGTLDFIGMESVAGSLPPETIEIAAAFLLIGAIGKSAQFPLYIWLPDAMAGPTPVSALIHAATMVTAGVYMITRMSFLYSGAPIVLAIISIVGAFTALLAATIALVQNDIKKVLAYSTVSQLGYMFMALGAGAFSNGIFHVVTHAFFKACLFMGAGSVIIGCHHEQDMRHFGGLRHKMQWTFITFFISTLAIAGFPWLSGFYSKDAILWAVFSNSNPFSTLEVFSEVSLAQFLWGVGMVTAFLTAFYMTRLLVLTFFGNYRGHEEPHESPWTVVVPLFILAILSALFGYLYSDSLLHYLTKWSREDMLHAHGDNQTYKLLEHLSMAVAISGIASAFTIYLWLPNVLGFFTKTFSFLHRILLNKWWVDEIFNAIIVKPLTFTSVLLFKVIDRELIDGLMVTGPGVVVSTSGEILRRLQTGSVGFYAFIMFLSSSVLILFWLLL